MEQKSKIRPPFLSALCILTFTGSGISFFGYFLVSLFFEEATSLIIEYSSWHSTEAISPVYFTTLMALSAISLTGAIRMWKLHRDGYYLYIFSQMTILFLPVIWISWHAFYVTNAIFTGIFIIGYGINLKYLK